MAAARYEKESFYNPLIMPTLELSTTLAPLNHLALLDRAMNGLPDNTPTDHMARELVHSAQWLLLHAETLTDAKTIHDHLVRVQLQFEQHKATQYATNLLNAQRIRTEWQIGTTLTEMPRSNGGRPSADNVSRGGNGFLAELAKAGMSRANAYRWMELSKTNPQDLDLYFDELQARGDEISTHGVLRYFAAHVTIDMDAGVENHSDDPDAHGEPPDTSDDLPQIRTVVIVCRHCGTKDAYEVAA